MFQNNQKYNFSIIEPSSQDWCLIENSPNSTCSKTKGWYDYLKKIRYQPICIIVKQMNDCIGYFVGERINILGLKIIGAPLDGTNTYTQGLALIKESHISEYIYIYIQLSEWLFENRYAALVQVDDWNLKEVHESWIPNAECDFKELHDANLHFTIRPTLFVNLRKTEDELWKGLHYKSCKYCINKANKLGLYVRVIDKYEDISDFAHIHYKQIFDVTDRKGMRPRKTQSEKRIKALCQSLFPDRVLMMEIIGKDEEGKDVIMSTGVFCIDKGECLYTTGASFRQYMKYCPNELMVWSAMKILCNRGAGDLNFGGMADYKLKFGTIYAYVPKLIFSKYKWVWSLKDALKRLYHFKKRIRTKFHGK